VPAIKASRSSPAGSTKGGSGVGDGGTGMSVAVAVGGASPGCFACRSATIERSLVQAAIAKGVSDKRRRSFRRFRRGVMDSIQCSSGLNAFDRETPVLDRLPVIGFNRSVSRRMRGSSTSRANAPDPGPPVAAEPAVQTRRPIAQDLVSTTVWHLRSCFVSQASLRSSDSNPHVETAGVTTKPKNPYEKSMLSSQFSRSGQPWDEAMAF